MQNSLITNVLLLLSLFGIAVTAAPELIVRQTTGSNSPQCLDYSRTANLSTISNNSTYRTAYIQASPMGTIYSSKILDDAALKEPALTLNVALNQQCGNLTMIAMTEAAKNLTMGIVGQFSGIDAATAAGIINGPIIIGVVVIIVFFMSLAPAVL